MFHQSSMFPHAALTLETLLTICLLCLSMYSTLCSCQDALAMQAAPARLQPCMTQSGSCIGWIVLSWSTFQPDLPTWPFLPNAKHSPPALQLGHSLPSRFSSAIHHLECLHWNLGPGHHLAGHVVGCCVIPWAQQTAALAQLQEASYCRKAFGVRWHDPCRM